MVLRCVFYLLFAALMVSWFLVVCVIVVLEAIAWVILKGLLTRLLASDSFVCVGLMLVVLTYRIDSGFV